ncbi:MAG: V-type ATP synthase subunit E [Promethearchaeota archaeon]
MSEAHETAEKIIQEARKTAQGTLDEQRKKGRERARDIVISINKKAQNDSEIIKLRNTTSAESKAKWLILKKKHELIENVLNQVKEELRARIKTDKYIKVLENLIVEGGSIVGETELEVILNERDSTFSLDLDKLAEKIGEETGKKTKLTKSAKKLKTMGGAIIQAIDGKIVMNNTFEGMLNNSESEIRFKIAQLLFT